MQQTSFPFIAVVHDDASTDGSADIIREYAEKYPDIIKPIFQSENQYSKRNGSIRRDLNQACGDIKYHALCEGDDYWTDPHKLQKQVDWLESHPEYSIVCCASTVATYHEGGYTYSPCSYADHDCDIPCEQVIEEHGRMAQTAGLVYRAAVLGEIPEESYICGNGDYRIQLISVLNGKMRYLSDTMTVYRSMTPGSWGARHHRKIGYEALHRLLSSFLTLTGAMNAYSQRQHETAFHIAEATFVAYYLRRQSEDIRLKAFGAFGYTLKANRGRPADLSGKSAIQKFSHLMLRLLYWPYHPEWCEPWMAGKVRGYIIRTLRSLKHKD